MGAIVIKEAGVEVMRVSHENLLKLGGVLSIARLPLGNITLFQANGNRLARVLHAKDAKVAQLNVSGVPERQITEGSSQEIKYSAKPTEIEEWLLSSGYEAIHEESQS